MGSSIDEVVDPMFVYQHPHQLHQQQQPSAVDSTQDGAAPIVDEYGGGGGEVAELLKIMYSNWSSASEDLNRNEEPSSGEQLYAIATPFIFVIGTYRFIS